MVLGIQPSRGGKSWGMALNITIGMLVITLYYFALAFSTALGEQGVVRPWMIMWVPNIIFLFLAGFLYNRMESEKWLAVSQAILDRLEKISKRIQQRFARL
jgi:lipopolysaccharide export LptBFGC system permease protein LptF